MRGNSTLYFISTLVSLGLYFFAPNQVDYDFLIICFLLFLLQAVFVLKEDIRKEGLMTYNVIFLFSFFLVTYAFPLFMMGTTMLTQEGIEAYIDFSVSSKCTALCTFAISSYFLAYKNKKATKFSFSNFVRSDDYRYINLICLLLAIVLLIYTHNYMEGKGGVSVDAGIWYTLYLASLPICLIYNCRRRRPKNLGQFFLANSYILILSFILIVYYFILGDRGLVIVSGVIVAGVYSALVKKLNATLLVVAVIVGSLLMYTIRVTRGSDNSLISGNATASSVVSETRGSLEGGGFLNIFADLTGIHRELYIGYDYVINNGLLYPTQFFIVPFIPLPAVPNLLSNIAYGKDIAEIKPGMVLNDYMAYSGHGHFGIHCVIDIFMRWGIIGTFLVFYIWGYVVASLSRSKLQNNLGMAMYIIILAYAIYTPRGSILDIIKILSYVIIVAYITTIGTKKTLRKIRMR